MDDSRLRSHAGRLYYTAYRDTRADHNRNAVFADYLCRSKYHSIHFARSDSRDLDLCNTEEARTRRCQLRVIMRPVSLPCMKYLLFCINIVLPDSREREEKNRRFFSSLSRLSGKTIFIQFGEKFGTTHRV